VKGKCLAATKHEGVVAKDCAGYNYGTSADAQAKGLPSLTAWCNAIVHTTPTIKQRIPIGDLEKEYRSWCAALDPKMSMVASKKLSAYLDWYR
jgi:hypothetical protein